MVNIKELSIGNIVIDDRGIFGIIRSIDSCCELDEESYVTLYDENIEGDKLYIQCSSEISPIPITEELLSKIGFEENKEFRAHKLTFDDYIICIYKAEYKIEEKWEIYIFDGTINRFHGYVNFIHQLQNYFYLSTEKELNINKII